LSIFFSLETSLATSVTVGVFVAIIQTKWESRRDWRFWCVIFIFAIIHIVIIFTVKFPIPRAGLVSLPLAFIDAFLIWEIIKWIERNFPEKS
jgi:uncharacterized membrane protein